MTVETGNFIALKRSGNFNGSSRQALIPLSIEVKKSIYPGIKPITLHVIRKMSRRAVIQNIKLLLETVSDH
jgi:hypothetical protein